MDFRELLSKNFSRPIRLLVTEPVVLLVTIYMSFIYGLLYLFFTAYPLVFQRVHHFNPGVGGLPFFGLLVGVLLAGSFIIYQSGAYNKKLAANAGMPIPEWRLPPVIIGGVCFAIGLFWFGWTGYKASIHWIVPTLSGLLTGFGLLAIFMQLFNYIIDSYLMLYVLSDTLGLDSVNQDSVRHPRSRRILSFGPSLLPAFRSLLDRCSTISVSNGLARSLDASPWPWSLFQSGSICTAVSCARRAGTLLR